MDCRTTSAHKFRKRLDFKQHDVILTKEPSVQTKKRVHLKEKICNHNTMFSVVGLTCIFITIFMHSYRNIDHKIKRKKEKEQELRCEFIRIDRDKEDFHISSMKYSDILNNQLKNL